MNILFLITDIVLAISSSLIYLRWGWLSLVLFVPLAIIPIIFGEYSNTLTLFITPLAIGTSAGWCLKNEKGLDKFIVIAVLSFSFLFTAEYHIIKNYRGYDMLKVARDNTVLVLEKSEGKFDNFFSQYETSKKDKADFKKEFITMLKEDKWLQFVRDMMPFISFIYGLISASVSFYLLRRFFSKNFSNRSKALEFFKLNDYMIFALIAGWSGFIFLDKAAFPVLSIISINTALITSLLYTVQALGVIKFKLLRKGWPMYILPLGILATTMIGSFAVIFLTIVLTGIGTLDLWADFRKLIPKNDNKGSK